MIKSEFLFCFLLPFVSVPFLNAELRHGVRSRKQSKIYNIDADDEAKTNGEVSQDIGFFFRSVRASDVFSTMDQRHEDDPTSENRLLYTNTARQTAAHPGSRRTKAHCRCGAGGRPCETPTPPPTRPYDDDGTGKDRDVTSAPNDSASGTGPPLPPTTPPVSMEPVELTEEPDEEEETDMTDEPTEPDDIEMPTDPPAPAPSKLPTAGDDDFTSGSDDYFSISNEDLDRHGAPQSGISIPGLPDPDANPETRDVPADILDSVSNDGDD